MEQYEYIRIGHRVYGKSIKELMRETGHSRNTIRKALRTEYQGYSERSKGSRPVLGDYQSQIEEWLKSDKESPVKQRHTARRIYQRLVNEHGYRGSESNVRKYVREAKRELGVSRAQAYIPLIPENGKEAKVDWGNGIAIIGGKRTRVHIFCMRSKYSGKPFMQCYACERQQVLLERICGDLNFLEGYSGRIYMII